MTVCIQKHITTAWNLIGLSAYWQCKSIDRQLYDNYEQKHSMAGADYIKHIQTAKWLNLRSSAIHTALQQTASQQTTQTCLRIMSRTVLAAVHGTNSGTRCATLSVEYWYNAATDWRYFTAAASMPCNSKHHTQQQQLLRTSTTSPWQQKPLCCRLIILPAALMPPKPSGS